MLNETQRRILKHAKTLRLLIIAYTVLFLAFAVIRIWFPDVLERFTGTGQSMIYMAAIGFLISAYGIWYVLNLSPRHNHSKTSTVLSLLFLGIVGLWMTFPVENRIISRLKASQGPFKP